MKLAVYASCPEMFDDGRYYQDAIRVGDFLGAFQRSRSCKMNGIEYAVGDPDSIDEKELLAAIRATGQSICMFATFQWVGIRNLSLLSEDAGVREESLSLLKRTIEVGAGLRIPVCLGRLFGNMYPDRPLSYSLDLLTEELKDAAKTAEKCGNLLTVEPQPQIMSNMLNTTPEVLSLIDRIGSDCVGFTIDVRKSMMEENVFSAIDMAKERLNNVHMMDRDHTPVRPDTVIDFRKIFEKLISIGYAGWATISMVEPADKNPELQDRQLIGSADYIREILKELTECS